VGLHEEDTMTEARMRWLFWSQQEATMVYPMIVMVDIGNKSTGLHGIKVMQFGSLDVGERGVDLVSCVC
jgi:hypothetical protein